MVDAYNQMLKDLDLENRFSRETCKYPWRLHGAFVTNSFVVSGEDSYSFVVVVRDREEGCGL